MRGEPTRDTHVAARGKNHNNPPPPHRHALEQAGPLQRTTHPQTPPKVEYTLTERGHSLMKVLDQLCTWGNENRIEQT